MGQEITVTSRRGANPSVVFFDLNRSLTGMAIERYTSAEAATRHRPPDVLARRLFALGATKVTVYSSVVTVEAPAERWDALLPEVTGTIEHLFLYYGDDAGWSPTALGTPPARDEGAPQQAEAPEAEPAAEPPAAAPAAAAGAGSS